MMQYNLCYIVTPKYSYVRSLILKTTFTLHKNTKVNVSKRSCIFKIPEEKKSKQRNAQSFVNINYIFQNKAHNKKKYNNRDLD